MDLNKNPYQACPVCPSDIRNLSATTHNLVNALDVHDVERIVQKFWSMKRAVNVIYCPDDAIIEVRNLIDVALAASTSITASALFEYKDELKNTVNTISPYVHNHFVNQIHSHGDKTLKFRSYTIEKAFA